MTPRTDRPAPAAVRARRNIVASMIKEAVERRPSPRILSVACGRARDLELVDPDILGRIEMLVGFDQDRNSLSAAETYRVGSGNVIPMQGAIVELLETNH